MLCTASCLSSCLSPCKPDCKMRVLLHRYASTYTALPWGMSAAPAVGQETGTGLGTGANAFLCCCGGWGSTGGSGLAVAQLCVLGTDRWLAASAHPWISRDALSSGYHILALFRGLRGWLEREDVGREVMNVYRSMVGLADEESEETILACWKHNLLMLLEEEEVFREGEE